MFAERLKMLRKQRGITQEELARIIGVERSSIGKYEGKSRIIPSDDVKYKIADFFGVSVEYLLGYTDSPSAYSQSELSAAEYELLQLFNELNESGQELVMDYLKMLIAKPEYRKEESLEQAT